MHEANLAFSIEDEYGWMGYAVVFGGVDYSVSGDRLLVAVGEYLKPRAGRLTHRPRERLIVHAHRDQFRARPFDIVVVLSQPGELLCASASPKPAIEYQHNRAALGVFRKNHQLSVAVWKREIRRFVTQFQCSRFSARGRRRNLRRRQWRLTRLRRLPEGCNCQPD